MVIRREWEDHHGSRRAFFTRTHARVRAYARVPSVKKVDRQTDGWLVEYRSLHKSNYQYPHKMSHTINHSPSEAEAEDQDRLVAALATMDALQTAEVAEDTLLEELVLLGNVDVEFNSSTLSWMLDVLQRSHNAMRFTDLMTGDLRVFALRTLCNWTEEAATPAVNIYMRTASMDEDWTIPELFHAVDLLPRYTDLVRLTLHYQKRFALYNQWAEVARVEAEAQARAAVAPNHPSGVADMMAEVAGWQAAGAVMAAAKPPAGKAKPPPLALKVPEFKEITDPGALAPSLLEPSEAEELAKKTFMDNTGRPGMAEVAGWHARDAVLLHGMSAAEAVQSAIKHLSMWTWATPEAKAKRAIPAPVDLGGAYGAGGEAEPVEGEPATPSLLGH